MWLQLAAYVGLAVLYTRCAVQGSTSNLGSRVGWGVESCPCSVYRSAGSRPHDAQVDNREPLASTQSLMKMRMKGELEYELSVTVRGILPGCGDEK